MTAESTENDLHETQGEGNDSKPEIPRAGVVYGDIIYWVTIASTVVVIIGSIITFVTTNNYIDPNYMLSAIWEGKSVDEIWKGATGVQPNGHWYLPHLTTGNGLTAGGIALGVFSVLPGIAGAAYLLFKDGQRLFGALAVLSAIITAYALVN